MGLRRLCRKLRDGHDAGASSPPRVGEGVVIVSLSDSSRHRRCSEEFVSDLCDRVMEPALAELDRRFGGQGWCREIEPSLVLEGPALVFKLTVLMPDGGRFAAMGARISQAFNERWDVEIDRVPPA